MRRDERRTKAEVETLLGSHDWNPAVASLGHVSNEICTQLDHPDAEAALNAEQTAQVQHTYLFYAIHAFVPWDLRE
jgi:hypothetical protein